MVKMTRDLDTWPSLCSDLLPSLLFHLLFTNYAAFLFFVVTSIRDPVTRNVRRTCRSLPFDYMSQIPPFLIISFTGPLVLRISIATLLPE